MSTPSRLRRLALISLVAGCVGVGNAVVATPASAEQWQFEALYNSCEIGEGGSGFEVTTAPQEVPIQVTASCSGSHPIVSVHVTSSVWDASGVVQKITDLPVIDCQGSPSCDFVSVTGFPTLSPGDYNAKLEVTMRTDDELQFGFPNPWLVFPPGCVDDPLSATISCTLLNPVPVL